MWPQIRPSHSHQPKPETDKEKVKAQAIKLVAAREAYYKEVEALESLIVEDRYDSTFVIWDLLYKVDYYKVRPIDGGSHLKVYVQELD